MHGHLSRMVKKGKLRQEDADLVLSCLNDQFIQSNLTEVSLRVRARYLSQFCRGLNKPVRECNLSDIQLSLAEYRKTHSQNTFRQMIIYVVQLMKHLGFEGVDKIEGMMPGRSWSTKSAKDMLSGDEVTALINSMSNPRDRALIATMYEGGFRPVEMSRLTWEDVKFDPLGVVINTSEKTGIPRYVRIINAGETLAQWQSYSKRETGPVFHGIRPGHKNSTGISPHQIADIVQAGVERAGIKKRVYPYLLRHSRVTHLLEDQVPESVIKLTHWGSLNTPMLATYGHISNQHIDRVMSEHAGIEPPKKGRGRASPKPIQCQSCKSTNLPGSSRCAFCGLSFTEAAALEDMEFSEYTTDPDKLIRLGQFLKRKQGG